MRTRLLYNSKSGETRPFDLFLAPFFSKNDVLDRSFCAGTPENQDVANRNRKKLVQWQPSEASRLKTLGRSFPDLRKCTATVSPRVQRCNGSRLRVASATATITQRAAPRLELARHRGGKPRQPRRKPHQLFCPARARVCVRDPSCLSG